MKITEKGQITIPLAVREQLGLLPHTEVEFLVRDGEAVLRKAEEAYEYPVHEEAFRNGLAGLEGRKLQFVLLQIVEPEINQVVLAFEESAFAVHGAVGGEVLQIVPMAEPFSCEAGPATWWEVFQPAVRFEGCAVAQARAIGEAWNGHGLELCFEGHTSESLIISSIDSRPAPGGFGDCLRVGVAKYHYCREEEKSVPIDLRSARFRGLFHELP